MPQITLTLTDAAAAKLDALVAAHNAANGTSLSLRDWLLRHLKELAIQRDLAARSQALEAQKNNELQTALQAERDAMLNAL